MGVSLSDISLSALLAAVVIISVSVYIWIFTKWHYWKMRHVPYLKPVLPIAGNMYDLFLLKSLPDTVSRIYNETKDLPYVGVYAFHTPVLFVYDLDIISKILIKDFNYFEDRGFHFNTNDLLGRNLIHQTGPDWKFSRSKLASCFNIGKVKSMVPAMVKKSEELVDRLEKEQKCNGFIETWDISLRYTTDLITSLTIGVDANSLQNKGEKFREAGTHMLGFHFIYHVFTGCFFPRLHKALGISVAKARVTKFFHTVVRQVIDFRKENEYEKKDVMQVLLQLKEDSNALTLDKQIPEIDDNFILAQAFIFFLAGFETPGTIIAYALYEIAKNPVIQKTLCMEITNVLNKHNKEMSFDVLQDMKYLHQVISETLRKYTPLTLIFRRCTKNYVIPGSSTVIEKGTLVLVPLRCIHEDPKYYPNPTVFDPDRFSNENSATRHIAAFLPFGVGPRICPAVLYSYIKIKAALVNVLRNFEVCISKETPSCLEANPLDFLLSPKNGIPLHFKKRKLDLTLLQ